MRAKKTIRGFPALGGALLTAILLLCSAAPASAATVTERPLLFSFDGHGATAGAFTKLQGIAVDQSTGDLYAIDGGDVIDKLDANGNPVSFSPALGSSLHVKETPVEEDCHYDYCRFSFVEGASGIAVDNSGGARQGQLDAAGGEKVVAFDPAGNYLWNVQRGYYGLAIDPLGYLWRADGSANYKLENNGDKTILGEFRPPHGATRFAFDTSGNLYGTTGRFTPDGKIELVGVVVKYTAQGTGKLSSGSTTVESVLTSFGHFAVGQPIAGEGIPAGTTITAVEPATETLELSAAATQSKEGVRLTSEKFIDTTRSGDVTVDRSSAAGHVFVAHSGYFTTSEGREEGSAAEFDASGNLIDAFGKGELVFARSIAYNQALDRVYIADPEQNAVEVFGPLATGTAPDASFGSVSNVGISSAKFSGIVNPQGVGSEYRFEWRKEKQAGWGTSGWAKAETSPWQSLPVDSSNHAVSYEAKTLFGSTTYEARLVAVNSANHLRGVAAAANPFLTLAASEAPTVTTPSVTGIGTTSVTASATVNTKGDSIEWWSELSSNPECAGGVKGFAKGPVHIAGAGSAVKISGSLTGLLPAQPYCVRLAAKNSVGTTTSLINQFTTLPVPPTEAETLPVPHVSDTAATLSGRANPNGSPLVYHFEYSTDGEHWTVLPDREEAPARVPTIVVDQATGLLPNTTYRYRFFAKNDVGEEANPQGGELEFTTRAPIPAPPSPCPNEAVRLHQNSTHLPDCRAFELVNNPDKGNQNVFGAVLGTGQAPITPDGNRALWWVLGGAPGANSGVGAVFLAKRDPGASPSGWSSQSLLPPAAQQFGGGSQTYNIVAAAADFSRFAFYTATGSLGAATTQPKAIVRLDQNQHQEILREYEEATSSLPLSDIEFSADGAHALLINPLKGAEKQIEDVGSGTPEVVSIVPPPGAPLGVPQAGGSPVPGCELEPASSFTGRMVEGTVGTGALGQYQDGYHRMATTNASRLYFQANPEGECNRSGEWEIYERNRENETTTRITLPDKTAAMIRATPDGRSLYFVTSKQLDSEGRDANSHIDAYRFEEAPDGLSAGTYTCLTCVVPDANVATDNNGIANQVLVSDDFSHLYFESKEQLVPGEGVQGENNLYALTLAGGELRFVATQPSIEEGHSRGFGASFSLPAQLSADGKVLVFASQERQLTADAVAPSCLDHVEGVSKPFCWEVYRYDDTDRSLECLSCSRTGPTTENAETTARSAGIAGRGGEFTASADGQTVAFVTAQALLPEDVNHSADVYVWHDGVLGLITDGLTSYAEGYAAPALVAIDAHGQNVFFKVAQPSLTGFEHDGLSSLYDARIDGGFVPPAAAAHCSEDSCQGPLGAAPLAEQPSSSNIFGAGNLKEAKPRPPCPKGRVRRHGRCVTKHRKHRRAHRRAARANQRRAK